MTKEKEYIKSFDEWAEVEKELRILRARHRNITKPIQRCTEASELLRELILDMEDEIHELSLKDDELQQVMIIKRNDMEND